MKSPNLGFENVLESGRDRVATADRVPSPSALACKPEPENRAKPEPAITGDRNALRMPNVPTLTCRLGPASRGKPELRGITKGWKLLKISRPTDPTDVARS